MIELGLIYNGNGTFRLRTHFDFKLCQKNFEDGEALRAKVDHQRSVKQNAYFHALIQAAWENQRCGPQFPTWEHMKSWLLIQAGHCDVKHFDPGSMTPQVAAYLRNVFDTVDFTTDGNRITMKTAKSVSFKRCDAAVMKEVVDRVAEIICTDIIPGARPNELFDMAKEKAA